jgi:hypothetical protein
MCTRGTANSASLVTRRRKKGDALILSADFEARFTPKCEPHRPSFFRHQTLKVDALANSLLLYRNPSSS